VNLSDSARSQLALSVDLRDAVVLLVDDLPREAEELLIALTESGLKVLVADSGPAAKQKLMREPVDLVVVDLKRADMDSFELCRQLKVPPPTRLIPVLFVSARTDVDAKIRAFRVGACDYLDDAIDFSELLVRIEYHIRGGRKLRELEREKQELGRELRELKKERDKQVALLPVFTNLADLPSGFVLDNKYKLESLIGTGGFGVVYKATHIQLQRQVAVKVFRPLTNLSNEDSLRRFRHEGASASRLQHPNAVTILDSGVAMGGIPYLAMELLIGRTLAEELKERRVLSLSRTIQIILPVCDVLIEAHAATLIHRDIKPENVFLHRTRSGEVIKILDFGIAKMLGDGNELDRKLMTGGGGIIGTPTYMAPERLRQGPYDGRSDVYSVGVMMYQMLSGRLPFTSDKESYVEIVLGHLNQPVPPLVGGAGPIPGFLIQVVMRTLEKDPTLRPTARELLTDLVRVARYTIDSGTTSGELALPRSEQFAGDGGLGLDAEKTGEVPALNVETSNASAKTLPPATTAAVLSRTIEEEPPTANRVAHERTQEFVRPGKSVS
jgi:serine/threonine protein kinase/CheY-like chemotaxis protein